ncbi:PAN domain-containing protein [Cyclospora cayetanensis]|uniref:PAN domain-containing protein n=1 Tax=Cyclospora cayetanensis TaxID=88456 RepID=A0A1D3CZG8_9EIME|nr:PAN domain-containing protein [Cyclospora cayetanensis]
MTAGVKFVALAALLSAAPAWGCFLDHTDYQGADLDRLLGKVMTAAQCQSACQGIQDCTHWTYQPTTNSCYMKSGSPVPSPAEGLISGPRICPGPVDCSQAGIDLFGDDIINTEVANALACQYQCVAVNGCMFWTFISSTRRCYMKGANVDPQPHKEAISGPRECPTTEPISCEMSTDFQGHDIRGFHGTVKDVAACQELCKGFNNCFYWTFVQSTASCYLKSQSAAEGREYNPQAFSGTRNCDLSTHPVSPLPTTTTTAPPSSCLLENYDYPGSDITSFGLGSVTKPEACQLLCQYSEECAHFTFFEGTCYFKSEAAPQAITPKLVSHFKSPIVQYHGGARMMQADAHTRRTLTYSSRLGGP